jgi:hypothetical protein
VKEPLEGSNWFFVDESGDPTFYNPFDVEKASPL